MKYLTTNIKYQIHTALDGTYNNGSGALVQTSPMINAIGDYKTSGLAGAVRVEPRRAGQLRRRGHRPRRRRRCLRS